MRTFRLCLIGTAVFVLAYSSVDSQAQFQLPGLGRGGALLTAEAIEKLKLTADQKEKYEKISTEYQEKQKESGAKLREAFKDKDKAKEALQNLRTEGEKLRTDCLAKVEALLTSEQKKTFEEVKNLQPQRGGFGGGAAVGGQVIPTAAQERLKLSEEQKKKVEDLQKELETKILNVLTEEQKKQYEEMKKGPARVRPNVQ